MQVVTRGVVFFAADYGMHRTSLFPESCHNRDIPPTIFDLWDGQIPASERNIQGASSLVGSQNQIYGRSSMRKMHDIP